MVIQPFSISACPTSETSRPLDVTHAARAALKQVAGAASSEMPKSDLLSTYALRLTPKLTGRQLFSLQPSSINMRSNLRLENTNVKCVSAAHIVVFTQTRTQKVKMSMKDTIHYMQVALTLFSSTTEQGLFMGTAPAWHMEDLCFIPGLVMLGMPVSVDTAK